MTDCGTCGHLEDTTHRLISTNYWIVNLSPDQGYLGRCYVILREHKASLSELSDAEWQDYTSLVKSLENACTQAFNATPFNWACMMNNAYQEEPIDPHVHWHFRPRHKNIIDIQGTLFTDPNYGHHYDRDYRVPVNSAMLKVIKEKITSHLQGTLPL